MKKFILTIAATLMAATCLAWGRLGHCTIQEIAWRNLTPTAKENIQKFVGDTIPAAYSTWLDEVVNTPPYKTEFAGFHASIATTDCRSPLYIRKQYRSCRDGVSAIEFFKSYLKEWRELPDSCVQMALKCIIHSAGDYHCPAHVRFTDQKNEGKFPVVFLGKTTTLHAVWDTGLIEHMSGLRWTSYKEYAARLDTWNRRQIKAAQKGWAREWFEDAARDVRPIVGEVNSGDTLTEEWCEKNYPLAELEIRKAGYQLAAALNEIFGK